MACIIPSDASEIPDMTMSPSATFAIETRLVSPSASEFALNRVPRLVHADRPLELELAAVEQGGGAGAAESVASWISAHALLQMSVKAPGQPLGEVSVLVKARPSGGSCIARVLVRPSPLYAPSPPPPSTRPLQWLQAASARHQPWLLRRSPPLALGRGCSPLAESRGGSRMGRAALRVT